MNWGQFSASRSITARLAKGIVKTSAHERSAVESYVYGWEARENLVSFSSLFPFLLRAPYSLLRGRRLPGMILLAMRLHQVQVTDCKARRW